MRANLAWTISACLLLTACLTPNSIEGRPLDVGIARDFEADFETTAQAADAALENVSLILRSPLQLGSNRVVEFERPIDSTSWGEIGRVVVVAVDADTTRVTVAVENRYRPQPYRITEAEFAAGYFGDVEAALRRPQLLRPNGGLTEGF